MYRLIIIWIGKILVFVTRMRGGGSALPGLVAVRLYPGFIKNHANHLNQTILVAGTNGKTTTTKMIRHILQVDGKTVLTNAAGSNMPRGVVSAMLAAMDWRGRFQADIGLFEIDEGFIAELAAALNPRAIVVLNLLRDQLDRYGELDRTASLISESLPYAKTAVLNADDPRVAALVDVSQETVFFAGSKTIKAQVPHDNAMHEADDSEARAETNQAMVSIKAARQADLTQSLDLSVEGRLMTVELLIPGVFNAYNAAAAVAVAQILKIPSKTTSKALGQVSPAFGRSEKIQVGNKAVMLLLVKNPSGFNQIINTYLTQPNQHPVMFAINDNYADGRDVSWLWDVDIEKLDVSKKAIITTGTRGYDMALRLYYAEIESDTKINQAEALASFLELIPDNGTGYIVPTYTAMLSIRKTLGGYTAIPEAGE